MTSSTEQERAAYERELIDNHHYVPSDFSFKDGFYGGDDDYIQFDWDLWQAARRAQLDDTNVVDMAQAVDSKEAASVQLPEAEDGPSSCAYCGQPSDEPRKPLSDAAIRDLYSEEVCWDMVAPYVIAFARSIEAAHGIQEQST